MKRWKLTFVYVGIAAVLTSPFWFWQALVLATLSVSDDAALDAQEKLATWTKEDHRIVWEHIVLECKKASDAGEFVPRRRLPEPLRRAGFKNAYVTPEKYRAARGGSSFGLTPTIVFGWPNGVDGSAPHMTSGGAKYWADGTYVRSY